MGDIAIRVDNLGKMYRIGVTEKQAQRWSAPAALLFSPGGAPGELSAAWSPGGQIVLAWEDLETGLVYTSWTPTASAMDETAWAAPDALPLPGSPARAPQLAASEQGRLFLACALLYNEGRGVYLLEAPPLEPGQAPQWGAPRLVFDAAAAGWDSVADPRLALGPDETPHLLWLHTRFSPESAPVELVYGRPVDGGGDWPAPALVAHEPAGWSQILAAPDGTLHRAWQEESSGRFSVWHQYSTDGGLAWSAPVRVTGAGRARAESLALEALSGGGLRLLEITAGSFSSAPGLVFQEWVWSPGDGWAAGDRTALPDIEYAGALVPLLANDRLAVVFAAAKIGPDATPAPNLLASSRLLPAGSAPQPVPTFTPVPTEPPLDPADGAATPTPALVFSTSPPAGAGSLAGDRWAGAGLGAALAALVVLAMFSLGVRRVRKGR